MSCSQIHGAATGLNLDLDPCFGEPSKLPEMADESKSGWLPFPVLQVNAIQLKIQAKDDLPLLIQFLVLSKSHKRGLLPT